MENSPIYDLPAEVFDCILGLLPPKDRKSVRLTCRSFKSLATRWVFRDVYIPIMECDNRRLSDSKRFRQLSEKYGHLVRTITVDGRQCLPLNRSLALFRYMGNILAKPACAEDDEQPSVSHHSISHNSVLYRASLMTPLESRILPNLRYLEVGITAATVGETGHPLLVIPSVETLIINGLKLDTFNFEGMSEHHGQTNLKSLTLNWPFINLNALQNLLMFPKALTYLNIQCCSHFFWSWNPAWNAKRLASALSVQRESLEVLKLGETERAAEIKMLAKSFGAVSVPEEHFADYEFDLSVFPRLRVYEGFYPDSSGKFKHGVSGDRSAD